MRRILFFVGCFLLATYGLGQSTQSTQTEPQGMQGLIAEVRLLRKDLQAANGNALKAQILLQRVQFQQASVVRASERLSDARRRLTDMQRHRTEVGATLKRFEEALENTETSSSEDRKQVQAEISARKQELEALAAVEQQQQTAEIEAEEQVRTEEAKLNELEDRLDRLEKDLDNPHQ